MKTAKLFGILALIAMIGFGMAGCKGPDNDPGNTDPVTSKDALNGAIAEAQELADEREDKVLGDETVPADVPIGTEYWLKADWDALNAAIATAKAALNASTQTAVTDAATALGGAIKAFNDAVKIGEKESGFTEEEVQKLIDTAEALAKRVTEEQTVIISVDGSDVPESGKWVTQEALDALTDAIDGLKEAAENGAQAGIDEAYFDLEQAIKDFEEAKKDGTKESGGDDACGCGHGEDCICEYNKDEWYRSDTHHWNKCGCGTALNEALHDWGDWAETAAPTETAEGREERTCNVCGKIETNVIPAGIHDWGEWEEHSPPTCTEEGIDRQYCNDADCDEYRERSGRSALDHDLSEWDVNPEPTYTSAGKRTQQCSVCKALGTVTEDLPPKTINDIAVLGEALANAKQAGTPEDPIPLILELNLGAMGTAANNWTGLLGIINTAGKYVSLDLSACAMTTANNAFLTGGTSSSNATNSPVRMIASIVLPDTTQSIGDYAFRQCSSLTSVTIPDSVTSIGNNAFQNCASLESVIIPGSVTSIGNYAFQYCASLEIVIIPGSVTSISNNAFQNCASLEIVIIPGSVTTIGINAFYGCASLESVTIPDSVTSIGIGAFYQCAGLTSVTIPNSVKTIGNNAFMECTGLTSVTIPDSVTSIGNTAFYGCTGLKNVVIGSGVQSIDMNAFYGCASLTSVTIGSGVTSIGGSAFQNCASLASVTIPDNVTSIGDGAFAGCTSLASVTFERADTTIANNNSFPNGASLRALYPSGGIGTYTRNNSTVPIPTTVPWVKQQ